MKNIIRLALVAALAAAAGVVGVSPAQAAGCQVGHACLWEHSDYNTKKAGKEWGNSNNKGTFQRIGGSTGYYDIASSAWANGGQCKATRWYVDPNQKGDWFQLNSQSMRGYAYKDATLADGVVGYPRNFNDKISSYQFVDCA